MGLSWFFWKWVVRWLARSQGFLDPGTVMAQLSRFGKPSEVLAPTELLRAGAVLHARGLINSQAIQHNLDWVWPYWVVRQFDPRDPAFVPRAFSLTHINLTHRNWTAVGLPNVPELPIIDPRGLLTPHFDGWSLDAWIVRADKQALLPSKLPAMDQRVDMREGFAVVSHASLDDLSLESRIDMILENGQPVCRLQITGRASQPAWLVVALRPYNPEGISFVHSVSALPDQNGWTVNRNQSVVFLERPEKTALSTYHLGDVYHHLLDEGGQNEVNCPVGMATAAALFPLEPQQAREVTVHVPLKASLAKKIFAPGPLPQDWDQALKGSVVFDLPDPHWMFLTQAAIRSMVLHAPEDVYPGPYTYKRFWFRDAAFILHAMTCAGLSERVERALDRFPSRQTLSGYFMSQYGEWDSNGQAIWILQRFCALTGRPPKREWRNSILRGAAWIQKKRTSEKSDDLHAGLLPAGFSAEHLGPNDFYYWDDFWGVAGLRAAAALARSYGETETAARFLRESDGFMDCIERSLAKAVRYPEKQGIPTAPYRRMDPGAIGSIVVDYPLQLWKPNDPRTLATAEFLIESCFLDGGFFQNISHSGINPYLTLHVAQVLLRAGDRRGLDILRDIGRLASPTGQWPEAVHPRTRGGCMGDGQHIWACAEWFLFIRNCFIREEGDERLILASGIPEEWHHQPKPISFGPAPTVFGDVMVSISPGAAATTVKWQADWRLPPAEMEIRLPGHPAVKVAPEASGSVAIRR